LACLRILPPWSRHLRLLDDTGAVLIDQPFQLTRISDDTGSSRPFFVVMPYHADTARIAIMQDTTELASRSVSPYAPSVHVLSPNGGEEIAETLTIQWESQDEDTDGDPLLYNVQYSPDLGVTWRALAIDHISTTLTVNTDALPGSQGQALIRVTATDGVNTGIDQSDTSFTLLFHPPRPYITAPEDGAVFDQGSPIIFFGRTIDAEDITVVNENLVWRSDRDSLLGIGRDLLVTDLSPGWHTITLEATDSDGQTNSASMKIFIRTARVYLPLIFGSP